MITIQNKKELMNHRIYFRKTPTMNIESTVYRAPCSRFAVAQAIMLAMMLVLPFSHDAFADEVDFEKEIWPILQTRCVDCHNGDLDEGQLRLDAKAAFAKGGVSGDLLATTKSKLPLLLARILGKGDLPQMPLDEDPLGADEIKKIESWLDAGAKWPKHIGEQVEVEATHWAYLKPVGSSIPKSQFNSWIKNPIDAFIAKKFEEHSLSPAELAPKGKLLRRVYLDLIGLPPTLDEYNRYLADDSPDAFEKVVDRLLASPMFGEKWARQWLDLARYADTNGFQADQFRSVWPYRDWVINSMNSDMPFDQFTIEQLAGDLIPNATVDQKIATGFHRLTTCNVEAGVDPEENRVNQIIDRVNTTGTVWFGTTFECMQCHNHKYDPFTQREYFEMFAFFNNTPLEVKNSGNDIQFEFVGPKMELPFTEEQAQQSNELESKLAKLKTELSKFERSRKGDFEVWLASESSKKPATEKWNPLDVKEFRSSGGATHKIQKDQSVLIGGPLADKDTYTVICESELPEINGFKFETLIDPSLPNNGPGRHGMGRPNFVVNEISATAIGETRQTIKLTQAIADFSQANFSANGLIDGKPATAWAINPQFGKSHWASVLTASPLKSCGKTQRFEFKIEQTYGGGRTIGRLRILALVGKRADQQLPSDIAKILAINVGKRKPAQKQKLQIHFFKELSEHKSLSKKIATVQKQIDLLKPLTTLVMIESAKRESFVFKRGNFLDKGELVSTATPAVLHPNRKSNEAKASNTDKSSDVSAKQNRLDFAKWICDSDNPLTARVAVNRWWTELYGSGIVRTGEDFGTQGERPTHPKLLDWLALEFVDSGWSMKHVLKTMVMSATYQQSSKVTKDKRLADPTNRYLARGPRFRMPAEVIRDTALCVADSFASKMNGPPIFPPQPEGIWRHVGRNAPKYATSQGTDRFRRGIYIYWRRSAPYPSFVNFDAPDRAACVVNRSKTNTPLQALTLLNDEAYIELARAFADRIETMGTGEVSERIRQAFLACTFREPNHQELHFLNTFFNEQLQSMRNDSKKAQKIAGRTKDAEMLAAWTMVAQILLNLDESITKD